MNVIRRGRQGRAAAIALAIGLVVLSVGMRVSPAAGSVPVMTVVGPMEVASVPEVADPTSAATGANGALVTGESLPVVVKSLPADTLPNLLPGLTLEQPSAVPVDVLGSGANGLACNGPPLVLDGQPQTACGPIAPLVVGNDGGTVGGWTVTGQISDFLDPAAGPSVSCDTPVTYINICIPGGDAGWIPQATLNTALSGTNAVVEPGPLIDPAPISPAGSVVSPPPGLNSTPQVLCQSPANLSQGQFTCGGDLLLRVPASAAAPSSPGYEATLTVTLS